jgi:hypothetical protein
MKTKLLGCLATTVMAAAIAVATPPWPSTAAVGSAVSNYS